MNRRMNYAEEKYFRDLDFEIKINCFEKKKIYLN